MPYRDTGGVLTQGYGHTGDDIIEGVLWKQERAESFLLNDLLCDAEIPIKSLVKVPLNENQFSALCSFVFNIGSGHFRDSTLLKLLNRGWHDQVPNQLMRWNRDNGKILGGLTRRRAAEVVLWNKPILGDSNVTSS